MCHCVAMRASRRLIVALTASAAVLTISACSSATAECISNDVGEVCANTGDAIHFRGEGLLPGSEVVVDETVLGSTTFNADADGAFDPGSSQGNMSVYADTEFTFEVTATDADGNPLTGQITISTG